MKKILVSFSAMFVMAVMLVSCARNSPKQVANTWLTSFYHMDYETAKKISTDETKKTLDMLQQLSAMIPDSSKQDMKKVTITVKDVKENGDKAVATYVTSQEPKDQTLNLIKQNGKWLVQWSKNDQMNAGGNSTAPDANQPPMANDTTGGAPASAPAPNDTAAAPAAK